MPAPKKTPKVKIAMSQKCKAAATTTPPPTPKQHRMTQSTVTTVSVDEHGTTQSTAATVSRDNSEPRPLTIADIPVMVNSVLESHQPSATHEDISPDHASAVPTQNSTTPSDSNTVTPPSKYPVKILLILVSSHLDRAYCLHNYYEHIPSISLPPPPACYVFVQYHPVTTAHTRVIFCVVPLIFKAQV